ncbi:aromatic ring-hydroxylating dioxygenase subunit alpha [Tsuneonella sp. HG222]
MFLKNCWYVAAWDYEITPESLYTITIIDQPVVIYRQANGDVVALEDRCCHRFAPLSKGRLEDGCNLRCMYHGLKFNPAGQCIEIPGQDKIPNTAFVRAYPAQQKDSWIWIWMGDPEAADVSLIPSAVGLDNADYVLRSGYMDYVANYQLINDNLTDFSHLSFVHANSFGATEAWARYRPTVRRIPRGIRVSRWLPSEEALKEAGSPTSTGLVTSNSATALWQSYDFLAPGILLMYSATYPLEGMPEDRVSAPQGEPLAANFTSQAVTAMRERSSRYFFSWGPRSIDGGDEMADGMFKVAMMAFTEDREMIEAQQQVMDTTPASKEVITTADVGPVQMRSVIRQLINAENGDAAAVVNEETGVPA